MLANSNFSKVLKLPRLYRIVRILRLFKMFRFLKHNKQLRNLTEFFQITSGVAQLLWLVIFVLFLTHVIACFWYLQATLIGPL